MAQQFGLVSYTICFAELIDHKIKIDLLTNFQDIVNFVDFPCNFMTKAMKVVRLPFLSYKVGLMINIIFQ